EGWTLDEALEALPQLAALDVQYCEQPLAAGDPGGGELRRSSPPPIYVDEGCPTPGHGRGRAHIPPRLAVKLAHGGGGPPAIRMPNAGRALGLGLMLGCMVESGLGIAPGAHIAPLFDHVDLDGNLLIREDPWPGIELVDGVQTPSAAEPGLGVSPRG